MGSDGETHLPKKTFTAEFFVGIFTIAGVLAFGYLAINIAGMRFSDANYYSVNAEFDSVAGLKAGAPIEIAGVPVGEVSNIVLNDNAALVTLQIERSVKLQDDDIAAIRTKGIIGDRYVKIVPGGSDEIVPEGGELSDTESAVEFEEIIGKFIHKME